jgi:hypothetical protein
MRKIAFTPFSLGGGLLAGLIAKRLFATIWALIDDQQPPRPEHREARGGKLVVALLLEGAVFAVVRGVVDHGSRLAFRHLTGAWQGDDQPEPR